jgi:ribonuclease BN (tRNA processing enzyme)
MAVLVTVIGSSPAWPNPGGAHSGYLVEADGRQLLLDCGPGVLARLRERGPWPFVDAIAITHFHLDHWGDLVPWVWGSFYRASAGEPVHPPPELWVHEHGLGVLTGLGATLGFPDMFERAFSVRVYREGEPFTAAGLEVSALRLPHYTLETYGFRVAGNGASIAYSGDSAPSERLADLARDVDLFLCEATLMRGEDDGEPRGHLSLDEALAAHERSGAGRLVITHRPDELPGAVGVERAYDGLVLDVSRS